HLNDKIRMRTNKYKIYKKEDYPHVSTSKDLLTCYLELESIDVNIVRVRRHSGHCARHCYGVDSTEDRISTQSKSISFAHQAACHGITFGHHAPNHDSRATRLARTLDCLCHDARWGACCRGFELI